MKKPQSLCQKQKKPSYPWNKDIIVWEKWEMWEENGRKKDKSVLWSCEREMRNKIGKRVGEWILLIKIGEWKRWRYMVACYIKKLNRKKK
jgi:hypothetical protein